MSEYQSIRDIVLESQGYPGTPVFDFYNGSQLLDVAQGLGLEPAMSRQVSLSEEGSAGFKASLKVLEYSGEAKLQSGQVMDHSGALATAITFGIIARLQQRVALSALNSESLDEWLSIIRDQHEMWTMIQGRWRVSTDEDRICLRLTETPGGAPVNELLDLRVFVPGVRTDLTPSGRVRLVDGDTISADVLAQPISWSTTGEAQAYSCIAHAVFARVGGYRFSWHGASRSGGGVDPDF